MLWNVSPPLVVSCWKLLGASCCFQLTASFSSWWKFSGRSCSNGNAWMYCRCRPKCSTKWTLTVSQKEKIALIFYIFPFVDWKLYRHAWTGHKGGLCRWMSEQIRLRTGTKNYFYFFWKEIVVCCALARFQNHLFSPTQPLWMKNSQSTWPTLSHAFTRTVQFASHLHSYIVEEEAIMCCVSQSQGFLCGKTSPLRLCPVVNTMEQTGSPSKVSFSSLNIWMWIRRVNLVTAFYSGLFSKG